MGKRREIEVPTGADVAARNGHQPDSPDRHDGSAAAVTGLTDLGVRAKTERNHKHEPAMHPLERPEVWLRVRRLALRQLNRLVALEAKVLRDESPHPVHDLRVASRRLQSLLDFLYPTPRPPEIRKLRRRLRRARAVLGDLRNQDVLAARIRRILTRKRTARRQAWETAHDYVQKLRTKTAERAHRKLTRLNLAAAYVRLRQELARSAEAGASQSSEFPHLMIVPEERAASGPRPALPEAEAARDVNPVTRFSERLSELWQDFEARAAESWRDPGALHALRIAAKRLRYLVEVAAELEVSGSAEAVQWLSDLQGKLGDWHDLEVLSGTMIEMMAQRGFLEADLPLGIEVGKLVLSLRKSKMKACEEYLREALKSAGYGQTAEWVSQLAASRPGTSP
ncbi:MAG TPA: CHAD domain-containing protein [Terriglobia bacterium]